MVEIPAPPAAPLLGEHAAVVEPRLRELPEFLGVEVSEAELVEYEFIDEREWLDVIAQVREAALADERVSQAFADRRHTVIGVSRIDAKRARTRAFLLVVFCHDDGLTYEVTVLQGVDGFTVRDVIGADYQSAPADEEIEAATRLAAGHSRVADSISPAYEAHALLVSAVESGDEHHGRRRFSVVFGLPEERLPRVHAVVDLGAEEIVSVHIIEGGPQ